jgi:hypothetical protein
MMGEGVPWSRPADMRHLFTLLNWFRFYYVLFAHIGSFLVPVMCNFSSYRLSIGPTSYVLWTWNPSILYFNRRHSGLNLLFPSAEWRYPRSLRLSVAPGLLFACSIEWSRTVSRLYNPEDGTRQIFKGLHFGFLSLELGGTGRVRCLAFFITSPWIEHRIYFWQFIQ